MTGFFSTLGPWLYPLAALALILLVDAGRAGVAVAGGRKDSGAPSVAPHHTVLAWGCVAGLVGLIGTLVGFGRLALGARAATGGELDELEAMLAILWEGAMVIVTPLIAGLWLFVIALVAWIVLQYGYAHGRS